jgi:2'-5' RNA ligase
MRGMPATTPPPSWRLFLGLWPPPAVRAQIEQHAGAWQWPPAARRTPPERLHITLHFLGNVATERVPALREALSLPWPGCMLELDRAEVWPGGIAVLEASHVPPPLAQLHARLGEALARLDVAAETRRYRPHVTLARKGQGARVPALAPLRWPAGPQYALMRSLPAGQGYVPVQAFG